MDKIENQKLEAENIKKLKELFPNIVVDGGKIDFEMLHNLLGEEIDKGQEKYQFIWNGKMNAIRTAQKSSTGTLRPDIDSSKNWDTTQNFYIEGDNLEVLKQLQKTYFEKVKLIYIDPPYNTGGDFVYKDDFVDSIRNYKELTNQTLKTNPETNGRYHTDWLNMIYPRLSVAKKMLSEDGVIFLSIDDNEMHNLRKICDEIFGENNFIATVIWERAYSPVNLKKHFSVNHDYILCYAKNIENVICNGLPRSEDANNRYSNPDNDPRGVWMSSDLSVGPAIVSKVYEIITPSGRKVLPPHGYCWRLDENIFTQYLADNRIWFGESGSGVPRIKRFLSEVKSSITPLSLWRYDQVGHSQDAQQKLKKLFNGKAYFDYPKSIELIQRMLQLYAYKDSLILDFFSGSATTAHAVIKTNAEDGGNRKFIMVQLPELTDVTSEAYKAEFKNICEIGKERIRRAGDEIIRELKDKQSKQGLLNDDIVDPDSIDIGFRVFKLDSSNIIPFESTKEGIQASLSLETKDNSRSELDIVYEIMLKYGIFDQPICEVKVDGKNAYSVGMGYMIVCLNKSITEVTVNEIAKLKPKTVIFDEVGFIDDNAKENAIYTLKRSGVEEIKSI